MAEEMEEGQRVHHEGRRHPTKVGWLQANGEITRIISVSDDDDEEEEPYEVVVCFGQDDYETYFVEQLDWVDALGGYWQVN